jgi:hypothetical protein
MCPLHVLSLYRSRKDCHSALFSATRLIESLMARSRFSNWSPSASSGGRPSSVSALLTARQYPRIASASSSVRPSSARSSGRTPRTCFFNSFLACRSASAIGLAASRQSMEMTELMRNPWQGTRDGVADRALPIGNGSDDRDIQFLAEAGCLLQKRS